MKEWNEEEVEYLKESYPSNVLIKEICTHLNRTYDSVMDKKKTLFLKRNKELKKQKNKLPFFINWNNIDECSFFVREHKSALRNKLWTTFNRGI